MELKQNGKVPTVANMNAFNRTRMELKHVAAMVRNEAPPPFNRTRMELKHNRRNRNANRNYAFNRTRMELKPHGKVFATCF